MDFAQINGASTSIQKKRSPQLCQYGSDFPNSGLNLGDGEMLKEIENKMGRITDKEKPKFEMYACA